MAGRKRKREALSVQRLINEVLIQDLGIPPHNVVNDTTFQNYTGLKRSDILVSNVPFANDPNDSDGESRFIKNLICYAEAKDINCKADDADWRDAIRQGRLKAPKLGLHYFAVTNCNITYFYNLTGDRLSLNGSPISEFQTMDVLRIIKRQTAESDSTDISVGVDSLTSVSEVVFNSKLWKLKNIYRNIDFENNTRKIDFTIGMISMEYYEEKARLDKTYDASGLWWSTAKDATKDATIASTLCAYIDVLTGEDSEFKEFSGPVEVVKSHISGSNPLVKPSILHEIYDVIDSMKPLHGTGFDLFGAVYEAFANSKEKKDFGEYFTRRHYTHIFAKLLLSERDRYNPNAEFTVIGIPLVLRIQGVAA